MTHQLLSAVAAFSACVLISLPVSAQSKIGTWEYFEFIDKMTDKKSLFIDSDAQETIIFKPARPEDKTKRAALRVACRNGQTELKMIVENSLIAAHGTTVTYRLDKGSAVKTSSWQASTDYTHIGLWSTKASVPLIKKMMEHKTMLIRAEQRVFGITEATFDLDGLKAASQKIRDACKW